MERVLDRMPGEFDVMLLEDGSELLRFAEAWDPLADFFDLVLLDSRVPGATGLDMLDALRSRDPLNKVPIMLLVGASGEDFRDEAMERGADGCLVKPLEPRAFMDKVERIVNTWCSADEQPAG